MSIFRCRVQQPENKNARWIAGVHSNLSASDPLAADEGVSTISGKRGDPLAKVTQALVRPTAGRGREVEQVFPLQALDDQGLTCNPGKNFRLGFAATISDEGDQLKVTIVDAIKKPLDWPPD